MPRTSSTASKPANISITGLVIKSAPPVLPVISQSGNYSIKDRLQTIFGNFVGVNSSNPNGTKEITSTQQSTTLNISTSRISTILTTSSSSAKPNITTTSTIYSPTSSKNILNLTAAASTSKPSAKPNQPVKVTTNNLSLTSMAKVFRSQLPASEEPVDVRRMPEKMLNPSVKREANRAESSGQEEVVYDLTEEKSNFKLERPDTAAREVNAVQEPIKPELNPVRSIVVDPIKPVNM
ncbi:unnamed protein product [Strongylus vulgaris]|uniref:Uncharacterized protein n=1 Tax=Strongylus vulgaris TaxID=40348 RepID=A0A3P7JHS5_STRVU|nr:unnamed protein product [Strongylus vulgaris]